MKILITGAQGQLGMALKGILEAGECSIGELPQCFRGARIIYTDTEQMDITDRTAVQNYFAEFCPDLLINCAAYTNVDGCESNPDVAFRINALGAQNLAVACEQQGTKMMHISTDYVFAGDDKRPYCEWDAADPQSVYGSSKWLGEEYVRQLCPHSFIVRTAWLYGYHGNNFVKTILKRGAERGQLRVVKDQIGAPTNAYDLAFQLLKIAEGGYYGTYHCTNKGECSWYDFACEIIRLGEINCEVSSCTTKEYPSPTQRPAYSTLDHQMLRYTVGDEMREWQEALASFMSQYNHCRGEFL